jgi:hypothetical protein
VLSNHVIVELTGKVCVPEVVVCWLDVGVMKQVCMPKVALCWLIVGMMQKVRSESRLTVEC